MKKITTFVVSAFMAGASLASAAAVPAIQNVGIAPTPEQQQYFRTRQAQIRYDALHGTNADQYETRTWTDNTGKICTMQFVKNPRPICELVEFTDGKKTFDEVPYYCVDYYFKSRDDSDAVDTYFQFELCWPSYYIWNQWNTYDGELDADENIPLDKRNYEPVEFDELLNSTEWCRSFRESSGIGGQPNADMSNYEYFTMLPNEMFGIKAMVDGEWGHTTLSGVDASHIDFKGYMKEDDVVSYSQTVYFRSDAGASKTISNEPLGSARIDGFWFRTDILEFDNIHIYNMGLGSSEVYGDMDPYTEEWGPLSQLYLCAGDRYVDFRWTNEESNKFNINSISMVFSDDMPENEPLDKHANVIKGVLYADSSYSLDLTKNPSDGIYTLVTPELKSDPNFGDYLSIKPVAGSFVPYGVGNENWSLDCGMLLYVNNYLVYIKDNATMAFGTEDGYQLHLTDTYDNTVIATGRNDITYHYDPEDVTKTRTFSAIGTVSSVDGISSAKADVYAANGKIVVTAGEDSDVTVYTVSGAVVANASVKAGASVSIAADKGIYIVAVGCKSRKVVL